MEAFAFPPPPAFAAAIAAADGSIPPPPDDSMASSLRDLVSHVALATENFRMFLTVLSMDDRELAECAWSFRDSVSYFPFGL
jgi:hypothetical protein